MPVVLPSSELDSSVLFAFSTARACGNRYFGTGTAKTKSICLIDITSAETENRATRPCHEEKIRSMSNIALIKTADTDN